MDEKMMICPKPCDEYPNCPSRFPHKPDAACDIGFNCPTCIPVPSTPASEVVCQWRTYSSQFDHHAISWEYEPDNMKKIWRREAASIYGQLQQAGWKDATALEARIEELKELTDTLQEKIETIKADQNKKIGEWINAHKSVSLHGGMAHYTFMESDIAKLQKGEF